MPDASARLLPQEVGKDNVEKVYVNTGGAPIPVAIDEFYASCGFTR